MERLRVMEMVSARSWVKERLIFNKPQINHERAQNKKPAVQRKIVELNASYEQIQDPDPVTRKERLKILLKLTVAKFDSTDEAFLMLAADIALTASSLSNDNEERMNLLTIANKYQPYQNEAQQHVKLIILKSLCQYMIKMKNFDFPYQDLNNIRGLKQTREFILLLRTIQLISSRSVDESSMRDFQGSKRATLALRVIDMIKTEKIVSEIIESKPILKTRAEYNMCMSACRRYPLLEAHVILKLWSTVAPSVREDVFAQLEEKARQSNNFECILAGIVLRSQFALQMCHDESIQEVIDRLEQLRHDPTYNIKCLDLIRQIFDAVLVFARDYTTFRQDDGNLAIKSFLTTIKLCQKGLTVDWAVICPGYALHVEYVSSLVIHYLSLIAQRVGSVKATEFFTDLPSFITEPSLESARQLKELKPQTISKEEEQIWKELNDDDGYWDMSEIF